MSNLREAFEHPGAAYRGKPFWAWNGKLEAGELQRQLRLMGCMGLGGAFMHSRVGLDTEYLSEEWFRMIKACVQQCRELGMEAWLYDEDRWPSGAAGGLVTKDPQYRHRNLELIVCSSGELDQEREPLALFSAEVDGHEARNVNRLTLECEPDLSGDAQVLAFYVKLDEPNSWFNNATYLDTMNPEAVQRFIEVTYEAYRQEVGEDFGGVIPGIFTDEPHHGGSYQGHWRSGDMGVVIPWTDRLPQVFKERYGYDLIEHLPELFLRVDGEGLSKVRWHYFDCTTHLFVDSFSRQIGEWCEESGLLFTGHVLAEAGLRSQASVGGAAMRFYEHMQAPGIDQLTEHRQELTTARQCSSVQHQMGRRWMLSELYGCTGWDWPFEGHRYVGNWQACLGVNLRCQHLSWYTMAGQAKRDYPASIHYQSPWWRHYSAVEDYFARVSAVLAEGEPVRPLLVIHPIESAWARAGTGWWDDERAEKLEEDFQQLTRWLLEEHLDFDYGDEEMMSRLAEVQAGSEPVLQLGQAAYEAVLVPPVDTLRSTTVELLREFADAGGRVVFCEPVPQRVDVEPSEAARELADGCAVAAFRRQSVAKAVAGTRRVSVTAPSGAQKREVFYALRQAGDEQRLFLINNDRENATGLLRVEVAAEGNVQLWDAETGKRYSVECESSDGKACFNAELPATGGRIYVVTERDEELPALPALRELEVRKLPQEQWTSELTDHNVLVLDRPQFRVNDGQWQGPMEVLRADTEIRTEIGLPTRGGSMVQPWAREDEEGPTSELALRYSFRADGTPRGPLFLAIENPHYFEIALNGTAVAVDAECGWWVDRSVRVLPLDAGALVRGENVLTLSCTMDRDCNLEAMFLLGDFAVQVEGSQACITGPCRTIGFGDWTQQGLPFYTGSVLWRTRIWPELADGRRLFVEVPEFAGACVRVLVDGRQAGIIGWQPHEVDVTELVRGKSQAELAVEVISHRRNAFGPLHNTTARPQFCGPASFVTSGEEWQEEYNLVPCGCMSPPRLSVRGE